MSNKWKFKENEKKIVEGLEEKNVYSFAEIDSKTLEDLPDNPSLTDEADVELTIFRTGEWEHSWYGNISFSKEDLVEIKDNFDKNVVSEGVALDLAHKPDQRDLGAAGWFKGLKLKKDVIETELGPEEYIFLVSKVTLNQLGIKMLKGKRFRHLSAEIHPDYSTRERLKVEDEASDEEDDDVDATISHGQTLLGAALTNRPAINDLGDAMKGFSSSNNNSVRKGEQAVYSFSGDKGTGVSLFKFSKVQDKDDLEKDIDKNSQDVDTNDDDNEEEHVKFVDDRDWKNVPFQDFPFYDDKDKGWNGDEAKDKIISETSDEDGDPTEQTRVGFGMYDGNNPDLESSFKHPLVMPDDRGKMKYVYKGVVASNQFLSETDAPETVKERHEKHLSKIYDKASEKWDDVDNPFNDEDESENSGHEEDQEELENSKTKQKELLDTQEYNSSKETNNFKETDVMKFADIKSKIDEMDDLDAQIELLEDSKQKFSEDEDLCASLEVLLSAKKSEKAARAERKDALRRKEKYEQQYKEAEQERAKLKNDLVEEKQKSRKAEVQSFCQKLEQDGQTQAVVDEVKNVLLSVDSEEYSRTFSVMEDADEDAKELSLKECFERVFNKMPDGPVKQTETLEEGDKPNHAQKDEKPVELADKPSESESADDSGDDDLPEKIKKFSEKNGYIPEEKMWDEIDEDGHMILGMNRQ